MISILNVFVFLLLLSLLLIINGLQLKSSVKRISKSRLYNSFPKSNRDNIVSNTNDIVSISSKIILSSSILASSTLLQTSSALAANNGDIIVLGSNGKTGKIVVEMLKSKGVPVVAASRDIADVTKIDTLESVLKGASSVIFAASASRKGGNAEAVDYLGVSNVAKECVRLGVPRLVVISSGAITRPDSLGFKITNLFGNIMNFKLMGEKALKEAYDAANNDKLGYIIIRPGGLMDGNPVGPGKIELNQGDTISGEVNRSDVAECAVAAALSKTIPSRVVIEMYEAGKSGPLEGKFKSTSGYERSGPKLGKDYEILFEGLKSGEVLIN